MGEAMSTTGKIEQGAYVSEWRELGNGQYVHKYSILGTTTVVYAAWEPFKSGIVDGHYTRSHSTITDREGVREWLGDVTMRDIPADMDKMPYGDARVQAVRAWYEHNREVARDMVLAAFPEDFSDRKWWDGEKWVVLDGEPERHY